MTGVGGMGPCYPAVRKRSNVMAQKCKVRAAIGDIVISREFKSIPLGSAKKFGNAERDATTSRRESLHDE